MSILLRYRTSDREGKQPHGAAPMPDAPLMVDPATEFWSPYLTAAEAELRIPGLITAPPPQPALDIDEAKDPFEAGVIVDHDDPWLEELADVIESDEPLGTLPPPPPPPLEALGGEAAVGDDYPFFVTPETEPIAPVPTNTAPVTDHDPTNTYVVTPETEPIAPVPTNTAPVTDHDPTNPYVVTPETEPIAPVPTNTAPVTDHDPTNPYVVTPQTPPIAPVPTNTAPVPVSELPPPPVVHDGERIDWSLHGAQPNPAVTTTESLFAATPESTSSATEVVAPPDSTTEQCPSCGSGAKIDLVDRRRGIQHLSCTSCYRVWQAWLEA